MKLDLKFIEKNQDKLTRSGLGPLQPLPGTPIWDYAIERGIVSENMRWDTLHYDFDTFNIDKYPILIEKATKEELYDILQKSHYLNGKINWQGFTKKTYSVLQEKNAIIKSLEDELSSIKKSKAFKIAKKFTKFKNVINKNKE